jgi:hypothetical protein
MSLDKAIEHGKERRKPYRGAKAIDSTCRNHGSCKWCENNRKHKFRTEPDTFFENEDPWEAAIDIIEERRAIEGPSWSI